MKTTKRVAKGYRFVAWITVNGEKIWARDRGLKAFRIPIY